MSRDNMLQDGITVHPHMRGADIDLFFHILNVFGSSPHAWGRCRPLTASSTSRTVHPHMRGADDIDQVVETAIRTVHPHMRGADT